MFGKHTPRLAASQSFCEGEIGVLEYIVTTILRGSDPRSIVRNKHFATLAKKVQNMRGRVHELKDEKQSEREREKEQVTNGVAATGGGSAQT